MGRFLILLSIGSILLTASLWYSSQSLPSWYTQEEQESKAVGQLTDSIRKKGVSKFLAGKLADVMKGALELSEVEFNALLLASLHSTRDGQVLLSVSDAINAELRKDELEIGVVLDLNKVAEINTKYAKAVDKITEVLPLLDKSRLFIAVKGKPIAVNGNIAFAQDIGLKIGAIPISSSFLEQLGVDLNKASSVSLPIKYLRVKSVELREDEMVLGVSPKF